MVFDVVREIGKKIEDENVMKDIVYKISKLYLNSGGIKIYGGDGCSSSSYKRCNKLAISSKGKYFGVKKAEESFL